VSDEPDSEVHQLGVAAAAEAIRDGVTTSEAYATRLLDRAETHRHLNAFITIARDRVLEAAREADSLRGSAHSGAHSGRGAALLGLPIGVKDSYLTRGLVTTFGGGRSFEPAHDADLVASARKAGAVVFGKNNLAEMSFGLTGENGHHGQVCNPYDGAHITGGSSSGSAAAVAARIVPAALGGDTIGSIRVPAALCGVVGFKPTPGRWSAAGVAPISTTLDTAGVLARNVEDCALIDSALAAPGRTIAAPRANGPGLRGVRLAYAPRQYLDGVDPLVEALFRSTLAKLAEAGATLVEVDLGADFPGLADSATWPIFFRETMPSVREFLATNRVPVTFEQIVDGLGPNLGPRWARWVVPGAPEYVSDAAYTAALGTARPELRRRFDAIAFASAEALLFPTTPCAAPTIEDQWEFSVAGRTVTDLFLARHTHPSSCAGLPGLSLPMGMSPSGLPVGIELDGVAGQDQKLLALARRIESVLDPLPAPAEPR